LIFAAFNRDALEKAVVNRVAQCILTCPTTAVFDALPEGDATKRIRLGDQLRFFGDGWQISKQLGTRRFWRMPTMDGEFLCEDQLRTTKAIAGGNILLMGPRPLEVLAAARAAAIAAAGITGVITPFPGGVVRSGSKVGSRYAKLKASTNDAFCPTLSGVVPTALPCGTNAVYEIVIDALTMPAMIAAMRASLEAAISSPGITHISAGNYGGKLGPFHLRLHEILA
ncbi:MAG: formylmethanofuran--tetrahydromethanopterin N-formyltransferase, partial [Gemmataceae bacterium]